MKNFLKQLNTPLTYLFFTNVFLNFFLILFFNLGTLPVKYVSDFVFYSIICFTLVMYRPKWGLLLFAGTIVLENINLAPAGFGMMIRPYQFIGGLTALAVLFKIVLRDSEYKIPKFNLSDIAVLVFSLAGLVSTLRAEQVVTALKQSIIILSFAMLYFLLRMFIKNITTIKEIVFFFLGSSGIVILYGIWQNIRFGRGLSSFEVMAGRPNATFTEPDWLSMFCVFFLVGLYSIMHYLKNKDLDKTENIITKIFIFIALALDFILLVITVARSAWLGAFFVSFLFLLLILTGLRFDLSKWHWREAILNKVFILAALILSIYSVFIFHLTTFQLFNRVQSTGTGLQKITLACPGGMDALIPQTIKTESEYTQYNCRHINLEEIDLEKSKNNIIYEVYRPDPNVNVRQEIYQKAWQAIKHHPLLGIGWGNINAILGQDERGTGLNSSNIFLEVWLGTGVVGLLAFIIVLGDMFVKGLQNFMYNQEQRKYLGLFILLSLVAIIIPNLFNAGIMLGILWLLLGIIASIPKVNLK